MWLGAYDVVSNMLCTNDWCHTEAGREQTSSNETRKAGIYTCMSVSPFFVALDSFTLIHTHSLLLATTSAVSRLQGA